jgi:hypothetical protein
MPDHPFCSTLDLQRKFFLASVACFRPEHAAFAPVPGMYSVAGQIAHAAGTVTWFVEGAFSPQGFDMDFPAHEAAARRVTTLAEALRLFNANYDAAIARIERTTLAELHVPIAAGPIMGGSPRIAMFEMMADHTAHHRGALTVYARLLGLSSPLPYA